MKGVPRTASNVMARIFRNALIEALRHRIVQISGLIAGVNNFFGVWILFVSVLLCAGLIVTMGSPGDRTRMWGKQSVWRSNSLWRILCDKMRRTLAVAIAVLISLPLLAPFFALGSSAAVPACCRRNGQHHCMGGMTQMPGSNQGASIIGPRCNSLSHCFHDSPDALALLLITKAKLGLISSVRPTASPQTEARYRIAFARSRDFSFALKVLPTIIFFSSLMSVLDQPAA